MAQDLDDMFEQLYDSAKKMTRPGRDVEMFHRENSELYGYSGALETGVVPNIKSDYHPDELFREPVEELVKQIAEACEYKEGYEEIMENKEKNDSIWPFSDDWEVKEEPVEYPPEIKIPGAELVETMLKPIKEEMTESEAQNLDPGTLIAYRHLAREAIVGGIDQAKNESGDEPEDVRYNFQFDDRNRTGDGWLIKEVGEAFERNLTRKLRSGMMYEEESHLFTDAFKSNSKLFDSN